MTIPKFKEDLKAFYKDLYPHQHIPFCIERSDGELLLMNNDFKTYSFQDFAVNGKWPYGRLFNDSRVNEGDFKVVSWAPIENLFNHPEKYFIKKSQLVINYRVKIE